MPELELEQFDGLEKLFEKKLFPLESFSGRLNRLLGVFATISLLLLVSLLPLLLFLIAPAELPLWLPDREDLPNWLGGLIPLLPLPVLFLLPPPPGGCGCGFVSAVL